MDKYESKIKVVSGSPESIFTTITDLGSLQRILPAGFEDKIKDLQISENGCSFTVNNIGKVSISIGERTPHSLVKYVIEAAMSLTLNLFVQIKEAPGPTPAPESRVKVTLTGNIPFMLKPLVGNRLQEVVNRIAESIASRPF